VSLTSSFALSARKTTYVLRSVFGIPISYQSVLSYTTVAAFSCHCFNLKHKGLIDDINAGNEAYIKVIGKQHYVFFLLHLFQESEDHHLTISTSPTNGERC